MMLSNLDAYKIEVSSQLTEIGTINLLLQTRALRLKGLLTRSKAERQGQDWNSEPTTLTVFTKTTDPHMHIIALNFFHTESKFWIQSSGPHVNPPPTFTEYVFFPSP